MCSDAVALDQGPIDKHHENGGSSCASSLLAMKPSGTLAISWRRYIQEIFALIEIVIISLIIAFLLASTIPGLLLARRKRPQAPRIVILPRSSNRPATV